MSKIEKWFRDPNRIDEFPLSTLYEQRYGYPQASVILDTKPPIGNIIINENLNSGGIKIHAFNLYNSQNALITNFYSYLQDYFDVYLSEASNFGGYLDESLYEEIGTSNNFAIIVLINDVSIQLKKIEICATALISKQYEVEIKINSEEYWTPIFSCVANTQTKDYIVYEFDSAISNIYAIRIKYKGDYFSSANDGKITVTAYDEISVSDAFQASRFTDFRDTDSFTYASTSGWVENFSDGISVYDWIINDNQNMWTKQDGYAGTGQELKFITVVNNNLVALSDNKAFIKKTGQSLYNTFSISSTANGNFTAHVLHKNILYVATSKGELYFSTDGETYTSMSQYPFDNIPITSLVSYGGYLYISSDYSGQLLPNAIVKYWNGSEYKTLRTLSEPAISCMSIAKNKLYLGASGSVGSNAAAIYEFNVANKNWKLVFSKDVDRVDCLQYSNINNSLWASFSDGLIYNASFNEQNETIWGSSVFYSSESDKISYITSQDTKTYPITGESVNNYVWMSANSEFISYVNSVRVLNNNYYENNYFQEVDWPSTYLVGLSETWKNSDLANYNVLDVNGDTSGTIAYEGTIGGINYLSSAYFPSTVATTGCNSTFTGYVKSSFDEVYTFYLRSSDGALLYINNELVVDNWTTNSWDGSDVEVSGTYDMQSDTWVLVKVIYANGPLGMGKISLSWSSNSVTKETIASSVFRTQLTKVNQSVYLQNNFYVACEDGYIYKLNVDSVGDRNKTVYLRLKDLAGNETTLPTERTVQQINLKQNLIYDTIYLGNDTDSSGNQISGGRIYQIKQDKSNVYQFNSPVIGNIFDAERTLRIYGTYISDPYYVENIIHWNNIYFICSVPQTNTLTNGLEGGVAIELYVRTADTYQNLTLATYNKIGEVNRISGTFTAQSNFATDAYNLSTLSGKWIQYKVILITAEPNITPVLNKAFLTYTATDASYFFTSEFNTENIINNYYNFVSNPDFESSGVDGWSSTDANITMTVEASDVISGSKSAAITSSAALTGGVYTSFNVPTNYLSKQLIFSMKYKNNWSSNYLARVAITDEYSNNLSVTGNGYIPAGEGTLSFSVDVLVSNNIYIWFYDQDATSSYSFIVDDIYLGPSYTSVSTTAKYRRGLLTTNVALNGGDVQFGYITDNSLSNVFDFGKYTKITPNQIFELDEPSATIRFGAQLVSVDNEPVIVHDIGIQLDAGENDMYLMKYPVVL